MNKYFVITQRPAKGSPVGLTNAILCDKFHPNIKKYNYGNFDWYNFQGPPRSLIKQFKNFGPLFLIAMDKRYCFDIRGIGGREKMYAASKRFIDAVTEAGAVFDQLVDANLVDQENHQVGADGYKIATFERIDISEISDRNSMKIAHTGSHISVKSLRVKSSFDVAIFSICNILPQQDTPICSDRTKHLLEASGVKGIEFTDIQEFRWPVPCPSDSASDIFSLLTREEDGVHLL